MTTPNAATIARSTAQRLALEGGADRRPEVEGALLMQAGASPAKFDPVSVGALIVSAASLAWTVWSDLRKQTPEPNRSTFERTLRVRLREDGIDVQPHQDIVEVIIDETVAQFSNDDPTKASLT